jgi:ferredoxin-type protein NapG
MKRRVFIGGALTAAVLSLSPKKAHANEKVRPPGALPDGGFERACIGCYRCAEVCPPLAIKFPPVWGLEGALPYLDTRDRGCVLCMKCTQACPTGALEPTAAEPEVVFAKVRMGVPKLARNRCLPWSGAGNCRLCHEVCPYPDRAVELVGPQLGPLFHPEACVGCGLCEEACPDQARAIKIVVEEKKK